MSETILYAVLGWFLLILTLALLQLQAFVATWIDKERRRQEAEARADAEFAASEKAINDHHEPITYGLLDSMGFNIVGHGANMYAEKLYGEDHAIALRISLGSEPSWSLLNREDGYETIGGVLNCMGNVVNLDHILSFNNAMEELANADDSDFLGD